MNRRKARVPLLVAAACAGALGVSAVVYSAGTAPPSASGTGQGTDSGNTYLLTFGATDHTLQNGVRVHGVAKQRTTNMMGVTTTITIDINCLEVVPADPVSRLRGGSTSRAGLT